MTFSVAFTQQAKKQLMKMDRCTAALITGWLRKNIEGCLDPRKYGKSLAANRSGQWRYRVGDYRVIAEIQDSAIMILVVEVGHRKEIYNLK